MSQENVEVVRRIYDALPRRDAASAFEVYAEDIVWDLSRFHGSFLWTKPAYHGHDGVRQAWREWLSAFGQIDVTVDELVDAGDKVLAVITERETGRASGVPVQASHFAVWTVAGGKVIRMQGFSDRGEALEAAGLQEAMSQENVEVARRLYSLRPDAAGIVRGDFDDVFLDYFDSDVEIVPPLSYPDTESSYRGQEGARRWFEQMDEIWDDWRLEAERFFDAGSQVVVFVRVSGRAKQSGAALAISAAHVLTLRDGRVTRADVFLDRSEALEAVGLRE